MSGVIGHFTNFFREDDGSSTIESLLWIPLLFTIMLLGLDVSMISVKQSMVMRIVQDGNRAYALGRFGDPAAEAAARDRIQIAVEEAVFRAVVRISPNARVDSVIAANGTITTGVQMPARDLSSFGVLPNWKTLKVTVGAQQAKEF